MGQLTRGLSPLFISYCIVGAILLLLIHPASPALRDAAGVRTVDSGLLGRNTVGAFDANLSGSETSRNTTWTARLDPNARVLDASLDVRGSPVYI